MVHIGAIIVAMCGYFMWICVGYLGYIRVTDAGIELVITSY